MLRQAEVVNCWKIRSHPRTGVIALGMSGESIISIISTDLVPFGANLVMIFGLPFSIRWYTSIFQKLHNFPGN